MENFEKLGLFYLGKKTGAAPDDKNEDIFLYDSKDLTTHAVCVGMTGSGKTGLCITLLEESAIDNIPAIIIDPKGDMGNLLLSFPELTAENFGPWIDRDEANRKNMSVEEYAKKQAGMWKEGITSWGQDEHRIKKMRDTMEMLIYTPGSNAGIPVSILNSFSAPGSKILEDSELMNERVQSTTSGVLGLLGIEADPLQSPEHIFISNLLYHSWSAGRDMDLAALIEAIQNPPLKRIGVFSIDSFFPAAERFKLALAFNNLLAAPSFKSWLEGESLDIGRILYTEHGRARLAIFSIAHLSESERMFFVTLLLNQLLSWMRQQPGTTSLRTILYMDEVFGYLPPVGNPPSKRPLLTLLKQARAFGTGVVLSTQNPVDLDYKALSNAGTWFIGRLQTEQDIARLIDGLSTSPAMKIDRAELSRRIARLGKRHFLVKNIHEEQPQIIQSRWALSYLRGPLTREQIKILMDPFKERIFPRTDETGDRTVSVAPDASAVKPQIDPAIRQYYAPLRDTAAAPASVTYYPFLIAGGEVTLFNNSYGVSQTENVAHCIRLSEARSEINWDMSFPISPETHLLGNTYVPDTSFLPLPGSITNIRYYNMMDKQYETFLYRNYGITLLKSDMLKMLSKPGENERDFRIRLDTLSREKRDFEIDRLKRKWSVKIRSLEKQLMTARHRVGRETDQYQQKKLDMAVSMGSSVLGALFGKTRVDTGLSRTARSASKIAREKQDIARAEENLAQIEQQLSDMERQLEEEITKISEAFNVTNEIFKEIIIRPRKTDIVQKYFGILWTPYDLEKVSGAS